MAEGGDDQHRRRTGDSGFLEERDDRDVAQDIANLGDVEEHPEEDVPGDDDQEVVNLSSSSDGDDPATETDTDTDTDDDDNMAAQLNANQLNFLRDFSGAPDEDIEIQVVSVNRARDLFNWSPEQTAHMASAKLKGEAARWLRAALKTQDDMVENLEKWQPSPGANPLPADHVGNVAANPLKKFLKERLLERFRESVNQLGAVDAVMDLRQRAGEEVSAFFDRVSIAVDRKNHHEADRTTPEYRLRLKNEIFAFFAAGLHDDLRIQALGGPTPPTTTDALLVACKNAELERKRMKKPKDIASVEEGESVRPGQTGQVAPLASSSTEGASAAAAPSPSLSLAEVVAQIDALRVEVQKVNLTCYKCGEKGHFRKECPNPPIHQQQRFGFRGGFRGRPRPFRFRPFGRGRGRGRGRSAAQRVFAFEENPDTGEFSFQEIQGDEDLAPIEQQELEWDWSADY